jgi:GNAT superfamily N-acetyltransferase
MSSVSEKREVRIVGYRDDIKHYFYDLNIEWLEKFFVVEPYDREVLSIPEKYILADGGEILFAECGGKIVGTVALMKRGDQTLELTKMGVTDGYKGLKIGQKLMYAAICKSAEMGANRVFLDSNRKLEPALALYQKVGFREIPVPADSPYERCNIRMELWI